MDEKIGSREPTLKKGIEIKFGLQSVPMVLAEFYFNRGLQRPYTSTCIILQKTINGFFCLLIVFLKLLTSVKFEGRDKIE